MERKFMIKRLQCSEVALISGGRFLPGLTSRLNSFIGKPLESVAKEIKRFNKRIDEKINDLFGGGDGKCSGKVCRTD
jgi:hypothetical protein